MLPGTSSRGPFRYLVGEAGIRQFLDVGTGLPTVDNTHEVAQRVAPQCRVVYVDNDPLVLAHAGGQTQARSAAPPRSSRSARSRGSPDPFRPSAAPRGASIRSMPRLGTVATRVLALLAASGLGAAGLTACSAGAKQAQAPVTRPPSATPSAPVRHVLVLRATTAPWRLAAPMSREVVLADGASLLVSGGLRADGVSSAAVVRLDPATGASRHVANLASATHDAGGAVLAGRDVVFGGGSATSVRTVQAFTPGAPGGGHRPPAAAAF